MRRTTVVVAMALVMVLLLPAVAQACGFLVSANGAVRLQRTTTFVAWEDGIEHYITNFTFEGPAESFGSIIPLPAEPIDVKRAGDWTLQRLQLEVAPPVREESLAVFAASADAGRVDVLFHTQIDALDVVVLRGGGVDVLQWVNENGFNLPPGPETEHMLEFYGSRSPYFLAARFDAEAVTVDEFIAGDGIPVQITIPTERIWVPLHILHGATPDTEIIEADVFLLTPERPNLLYGEGMTIERSEPATDLLLDDLRSDENMEWVPEEGWFTYLKLETEAENVLYDLSGGIGDVAPSFVAAGFTRFEPNNEQLEAMGLEPIDPHRPWWLLGAAVAIALIAGAVGGLVVASSRQTTTTVPGEPVKQRVGV